ncbi:MAG TPA: hypothetical protein VL860_06295, partial [Planctomycetota bacterium]|nr:hypothetical protein [Planctomycetota bacterium]
MYNSDLLFAVRRCALGLAVLLVAGLPLLRAEDAPAKADDARLILLEQRVQLLQAQVANLQAHEAAAAAAPAAGPTTPGEKTAGPAWRDRIDFGMYGELIASFDEGNGPDTLEIARFVFFFGYEFADWIHLNSEVEIEHAFVEDGQGELNLEQCSFDFTFYPAINLRAGRFLAPVSALNLRHEPLSFNGVLRPAFDTFIVPTTWSVDGVEAFGTLTPELKYQLGLVSGLSGPGFTPLEGPEEARQEHIASLHQMAVVARLELTPLVRAGTDAGHLRFGLSTFQGGLNNGDVGLDPGIRASMALYEGDVEYNVGIVDVRGAAGWMRIYKAR